MQHEDVEMADIGQDTLQQHSPDQHYTPAERLRSTFRHLTTYTLQNAPLLRFVYKKNRYNRLDPQGRPLSPVGESNDGVFSNMSAKPTVQQPSDRPEQLPSYDEAVEDPAPPYWESSIMAGYEDEIFVDGLPVGNLVSFFWNMTVSICFQFVGFVITYLLHTSHAAKNGSRAGLGITLMTFGWGSLPFGHGAVYQEEVGGQRFEPEHPSSIDIDDSMALQGSLDSYESNLQSTTADAAVAASHAVRSSLFSGPTLFSYVLIVLGAVILSKAVFDYCRAIKKERRLTGYTERPEQVV